MMDERMLPTKAELDDVLFDIESDLKVLKRRAEQEELNFAVLTEFMESIRETSVRGLNLLLIMKGGYRS